MSAARVLVVGAGVSGLTCALCLRRQGWEVTVAAERFAPHVESVVAGALWEYPPAVCGQHSDPVVLGRSKAWCLESYSVFAELAARPDTGVFMRKANFFFRQPIAADPQHTAKARELQERVPEFVHDAGRIALCGVNPRLGLQDCYSHLAPMIDTDAYMAWLLREIQQLGCRIESARIEGPLASRERALRERFGVEAIVNCSGLGARELAGDDMYPLRGALIRVHNDGRSMPRITEAYCVAQGEWGGGRDFVFVVPRGDDMLVLGGLAEPDEWNVDVGLESYPPIREMFERCIEFLPALKSARIDRAEPVRVGLRPMRQRSIRLEREPHTQIIHNYGHGGSGVTLSWGCARAVAQLVRDGICN
jgi:D-amino-acid oxidase